MNEGAKVIDIFEYGTEEQHDYVRGYEDAMRNVNRMRDERRIRHEAMRRERLERRRRMLIQKLLGAGVVLLDILSLGWMGGDDIGYSIVFIPLGLWLLFSRKYVLEEFQ